MSIKEKIFYGILTIFLLFSKSVFAGNIIIPIQEMSIASFLKMILSAMLDLATPVIVLAIVYVGFLFVKAQGNDGKLTEAKQALTWVLVGTAVVIGSNALYNIFFAALPA